jgi:hypothetical protein
MSLNENAVAVLKKAIEVTVDAGLLSWALTSDTHKEIALERLEVLVNLGVDTDDIPRSSIEAAKVVVDKLFTPEDEILKRNGFEKWGANIAEK